MNREDGRSVEGMGETIRGRRIGKRLRKSNRAKIMER